MTDTNDALPDDDPYLHGPYDAADEEEYAEEFGGRGNHWLAESGSTKTDWVCFTGPEEGQRFQSGGINPSYLTPAQLREELVQAVEGRGWTLEEVETFTWYGAGCAGMEPRMAMSFALMELLPSAGITVQHDLMAAARATCGEEPGLVAILGTGSHAAAFDGYFLQEEAVNLGYLLGDEGGGADMGRRLLTLYFYNRLPPEEADYLSQTLALTRDAAVERLYRRPWPNRWLASMTPHIAARPALRSLVALPAMQAFADTHLLALAAQTGHTSFSAVGSVAAYFEDEVRQAVKGRLMLKQAIASPLEQLILYHQQHGFRP